VNRLERRKPLAEDDATPLTTRANRLTNPPRFLFGASACRGNCVSLFVSASPQRYGRARKPFLVAAATHCSNDGWRRQGLNLQILYNAFTGVQKSRSPREQMDGTLRLTQVFREALS
jgi:hypothetical protein